MAATVVYVHGNGNKIREDLLKSEWDRALFGRDMGARSVMAYWASLRYPQPLPAGEFDGIDVLPVDPVWSGVDPVELQAETRLETHLDVGLDDFSTELDPWLQRLAFQADALVEGAESDALLPLPRAARVALFRALVKVTFKDVYAYFFGGFAEPMRDVLRKAIAGTDGPLIVVGHSLGTIIAYDVLREDSLGGREIPLLVTAGSPLAVQEVQDLVVSPLRVPAGVTAWRNVADARDLVALDATIRPEYAPENRCADFLVANNSLGHHGIREYLSTAAIRDAVAPFFA